MDFKERYFNLWEKAWNFHKKWHSNSWSEEEWRKIITEAGDLYKRHQDEQLLKELLLAVLSELEREDKRRQDGDREGQEAEEMATSKNIDKL
nr:hypothetical protein [uncultured Schaedlerella sp.]